MNEFVNMGETPIVLGYSGGLDTSFLIPWLIEKYHRPVITVTVNTGGLDEQAAQQLAVRAEALGASAHHLIDARMEYFTQVLRFLIMGNVKRGHLYPLCVGAERVLQAQILAQTAQQLGARAIAHGCTAAGNDQIRFEVALRSLAPDLEIVAPIRDQALRREDELHYLTQRGLPVPPYGAAYSVNRGLWGVTIGGRETLGSTECIPEQAWLLSSAAFEQPKTPRSLRIEFEEGIPCSLDSERLDPVALIEKLESIAAAFAIGRGVHLGDTIIGTKGRVAFEAPAAVTLIEAHRELEKLVLTAQQQRIKDFVSQAYGDWVHEGQLLNPVCRDIEALLLSSQKRVNGAVSLQLRPGSLFVSGVSSKHSLMSASKSVYGESLGEWTPADARGFGKIAALPCLLHQRAAGHCKSTP
jgi:argininosuccinate synthase